MTNSTKTILSTTAVFATPAQKRAVEEKQIVTPVEFGPAVKFPLYAFTVEGKATRGAQVFNKHHHFCHVGLEDFKAVLQKYRINNAVLARMLNGVGKTTAREGYVYVSYDQQIGLPNPYKKAAPYRKACQDYLNGLPLSTVVVSSNKLVLELASRRGHRVLHRDVNFARVHDIEHTCIYRGRNHNAMPAVMSLFFGSKVNLLVY